MKTRDEYNRWHDENVIVMAPLGYTEEQTEEFKAQIREKAYESMRKRNTVNLRKVRTMFKLGNDGYSMTFENGYTVSVRWHKCIHYVTDRTLDSDTDAIAATATDSVDAEVAVIHAATTRFVETPFSNSDTVIGYQSPDQVHEIMAWTRELPHG